jgi:hypothetical protein
MGAREEDGQRVSDGRKKSNEQYQFKGRRGKKEREEGEKRDNSELIN